MNLEEELNEKKKFEQAKGSNPGGEKVESYRYKDFESYKVALSTPPPPAILKERSLGGNKTTTYEPIEVKQSFADVFFREWNVVDEKYFNILNEIVCTTKINALPDYPGADFITFTGSASKPIQIDAGTKTIPAFKPFEFPKGKKANALEYCLPAVRSEAIGNAFETLGNIFGRSLGRSVSNDFGFNVSYNSEEK